MTVIAPTSKLTGSFQIKSAKGIGVLGYSIYRVMATLRENNEVPHSIVQIVVTRLFNFAIRISLLEWDRRMVCRTVDI